MAALESNGFTPRVQPVHLCLVSVARSVPPRVAHPPPSPCSTESVCQFVSAPDFSGDVCSDAPINCRTAALSPQAMEET